MSTKKKVNKVYEEAGKVYEEAGENSQDEEEIDGEESSEIFADSGSEIDSDEFSGYDDDDLPDFADKVPPYTYIRKRNRDNADDADDEEEIVNPPAPSAYVHPWLYDFYKMYKRKKVGPQKVSENLSECQVFKLFITDELLELCVKETNRYATEYISSHTLSTHSRMHKWKKTDVVEMQAFISILLLSGISKRSNFELYWSTDSLLDMRGFREIMPRDRFLILLQFFHVVNNNDQPLRDDAAYDKAFKIRPVIDYLVPKWQQYFGPDRELSVDESIIPFKGRTTLKQYMPDKPNKWGLKAWCLADAASGYVYNWKLYLGKEKKRPQDMPVSEFVVRTLTEPILNKAHIVYMDNFFSSPKLFKFLEDNLTGACGTLRVSRTGVPSKIKRAEPKANQPPITAKVDNTLYLSWYDRRIVNLISTVHSDVMYKKKVRVKNNPEQIMLIDKPAAIQAYSRYMGGVDRADKAITYYMVHHRTCKWWKKVFFYLLEVSFCNALIIWRKVHEGKTNPEQFRLNIIHGMLHEYKKPSSRMVGRSIKGKDTSSRLIDCSHFLGKNTKKTEKGKSSRPDCAVCSDRKKKRHQTKYECKKCKTAMCPVPCFERWHTLDDYKIDCTPQIHGK